MPALEINVSNHWPPELLKIIEAAPMPGLGGEPRDAATKKAVDEALKNKSLAGSLTDGMKAGLWLLAGELDRSHEISQEDHSADGSFWHGIMHRREGDFWNSKYWMRKVGRHAVIDELARRFPEYQDAFHFVDQCEAAVRGRGDVAKMQQIQWAEWQLLVAQS